MMGHVCADPESYRTAAEREEMRANDCMPKIEAAVRDRGLGDEIDGMRAEVEARVDEAIEYSLEQPFPDPELATRDVFSAAEGGGGRGGGR
jgi:pyruvate dehydrogenase E1 component alpha subunit